MPVVLHGRHSSPCAMPAEAHQEQAVSEGDSGQFCGQNESLLSGESGAYGMALPKRCTAKHDCDLSVDIIRTFR